MPANKTVHLPVLCKSEACPHYGKCCLLPTSVYYSTDEKVHILIVGQGGGWQEERDHLPWVGDAGQLLRTILRELKLECGMDVGIALTNTVRCRPTKLVDDPERQRQKRVDREPTPEELRFCIPYLYTDIDRLKPFLLILAGGSAASAFGYDEPVTKLRVKVFNYNKIPLMITYHPAGVLRRPAEYSRPMRKDFERAFNMLKPGDKLPF